MDDMQRLRQHGAVGQIDLTPSVIIALLSATIGLEMSG